MNRPTLLLLLAAIVGTASAAAQDIVQARDALQPFELTAPMEFQGVWERQFAPFLHPAYTRNWANVRIESIDANDGSVSGHFDVYVRNLCSVVVDQPFKGSFDGTVLRINYDYTQCPGMEPLHLTLWKKADGFHGRTLGVPITIEKVFYSTDTPRSFFARLFN